MTMNSKHVRMGVIGAGSWGTMHARAYHQHAAAELVGICDLDAGRAAALARKYGAAHSVTRVADLLKLELDAVSVATPDDRHLNPVLAALEAGIHVLVEKPLAMREEECRRMIEAAEAAGVRLMVDWHNRWNPPAHEAYRAIRDGELGDIVYIYYRLSDTIHVPTQMLPWAGESSVLHFLGSHAIDTVCWLLDETPFEVSCRRKDGVLRSMGVATADLYLTTLEFPSGTTVLVENSWILPQSAPALIDHRWEVLGTHGVLTFDATHNRAVAKYTRETPRGFPNASFPDLFVTPEVHGRQLGFCVEPMYHFVECVRDGVPPLTSGQDGLRNAMILAAAERAAETRAPVAL